MIHNTQNCSFLPEKYDSLEAFSERLMLADLSIVIPVYRSAEILPQLASRLEQVLPGLAQTFEVLLVCDGSPDNSWTVIRELAAKHKFIKGVNLAKNYGQHNALLIGIREAKHSVIVTMDDDLQHPPEEIHKLLTHLNEGYDVVYGMAEQLKHNVARNIASSSIKYMMQQMIGYENAGMTSAFRAFRTKVRDSFAAYHDKFVSIDILLTWGTSKFSRVLVQHNERHSGVSGYNIRKLLLHTVNIVTSFSSIPLQLASMLGFLFMMLGVVTVIYVLITYMINGGTVPGFTFLASLISIFSGVQLFSLGVIGEYLSRIHFRSMGQPYGIIREKTDD